MAEQCTIYCRVKRFGEVQRLAREFISAVEIAGAPDQWRTLKVDGKSGLLRLTSKWYQERGDEFCRLLLSTCTSIEGVSGIEDSQKKQLTSHIETSKLVLISRSKKQSRPDGSHDYVYRSIL